MPPGITWNLFEWVRKTGQKRSDAPTLMGTVQPTVLLGDHSAITSPVLPPIGWFGGQYTSNGVDPAVVKVASRGKGGCFVLEYRSAWATGIFSEHFDVNATNTPLTGEVFLPSVDMGPEAVKTGVSTGSGTIFAVSGRPMLHLGGASVLNMSTDFMYIPPGNFGYFQLNASAAAVRTIGILIQDVPEAIPEP